MVTRVDDRDVRRMFNQLPKRTRNGIISGLNVASLFFIREAENLMRNSPHSGRLYPSRSRKGRLHQASAPGEPPAPDTGRLIGAFGHEVVGTQTQIQAAVLVNINYAEALEFGTSKMAARPFMRPTLASTKDEIQKKLAKVWRRELVKMRKR